MITVIISGNGFYKKVEENHIERPIIEEPIQIVPEEQILPPQAPQEP